MFETAAFEDFSELHIVRDKAIDFSAVICLHNNGLGPALGGCRFVEYPTLNAAIQDAIRLSKAMSYKAAISELAHDGGKAVIVQPKNIKSREKLLNRFAEFVDTLGGKYITTIDSGTSQEDMSIIKNITRHVTGYLDDELEDTNPSTSTALGVFEGIKSAVKLKYGSKTLEGMHVAIQGVGNVGYRLAKLLNDAGVELTVCDIKNSDAARCADEFNAAVVAPMDIYSVACDVFAPCALGRIINPDNISRFKTKIIAGAANDQLLAEDMAESLHQKDILFIPDFVINAGGLIHLSLQMQGKNKKQIANEVLKIANRIHSLSEQANKHDKNMFRVAEESAQAIIQSAKKNIHHV